jgi:hypothetical protein
VVCIKKRLRNRKSIKQKFFVTQALGLAQSGSRVYLTTSQWDWSNDLWTLDEVSGKVLGTEHFDHYILPPTISGDRIFIAADLYLMSFSS